MCRGLMGCVIIIVNVIVMVVGLAFVIGGSLLLWSKPVMKKLIDILMEELSKHLEGQSKETAEQMVEEIMKLSTPTGWGIFGIGIVLVVLAVLAFVGVCCHISLVLIIYALLVGIVIIAHLTFVIVYFVKKDWVYSYLHDFLQKQVKGYISVESGETNSLLVAATMITLKCCGYNNGSDFLELDAQFSHRDKVGDYVFYNLSYPIPCCKNIQEASSALQSMNLETLIQQGTNTTLQQQCPNKFTTDNSNIDKGCRKIIDEDFKRLVDLIVYVSLAALFLEIILFLFAVLIVVLRKNE